MNTKRTWSIATAGLIIVGIIGLDSYEIPNNS
jgi:hypothetical protein